MGSYPRESNRIPARDRYRPRPDLHEQPPPTNTVSGEVTRLVYAAEDESYSVVRVHAFQGREYTAVGVMPGLAEGQTVELTGKWEMNPEHGLQLRVAECRFALPATPEGITRYLASGILPGVGPKTAAAIVEHFGTDTLQVLDTASRRLREIPGLGKTKIAAIRAAWTENADRRELRIFCEGLGITPAYFSRICKRYGDSAAQVIRENPYRLASEVRGIGFLHADRIAEKMGVRKNDLNRLIAGVAYALEQIRLEGHVCIPKSEFIPRLVPLLGIAENEVEKAVSAARSAQKLVSVATSSGNEMFYEPAMLHCEDELPVLLGAIRNFHHPAGEKLAAIPPQGDSKFSDEQLNAVNHAAASPLTVITGGPGVGKTTVIFELVRRARAAHLSVILAAPTGRAAKRLSEATGAAASTIHRLLKWDPIQGNFVHSVKMPVTADLLVIDEASMLDLPLAVALFRAIRPGTSVVIVGDPDQLPPVGPGNVLNDLIASGLCPVSRLTRIFRQGDGSGIIRAAHEVNAGIVPQAVGGNSKNELRDFYWIEKDEPAEAAAIMLRMIAERIPARFGFDPVRDVQMLTPMNRGDVGTLAMNKALQALLNGGDRASFSCGEQLFKVGDKVMQTANNYDKGVFNGDTGILTSVDTQNRSFQINYDGQNVEYSFEDADQIVLAYAVTVHKSQGSEFPVVVMPLLSQHYMMLQRNLLYTGMTRAKRLMILVGSRRAVAMAVRNAKSDVRYSLLYEKFTLQAHRK